MTDVVSAVPAAAEATPPVAPQADVTATPAPGGQEPAQEPKTFTQEEVDALIGKRLAREERKWQREADRRVADLARQVQPRETQQPQTPAKPQPDQFKTTEEYVEALAEHKATEIFRRHAAETEKQARERQAREAEESAARSYQERVATIREKYADYDDVVGNPNLPITKHMAQTIAYSEQGPDVAYYLGQNPQEAARIAHLSPFLQAKELGRIEAKLATAPAQPVKTSKAPEPIKPVSGKAPVASDDPSDKDDIETWRKKRERQVYGARSN